MRITTQVLIAFEPPEADDPGGWVLAVLGKGDRLREVTLLDEVMAALRRYLAERGLPGDLAAVDPGVYLIGRVDDLRERLPAVDALQGGAPLAAGDGVKGTTLYREVKGFFAHCAEQLQGRDAKGAARLRAASTHWLRHSHATHALARGVPLQIRRPGSAPRARRRPRHSSVRMYGRHPKRAAPARHARLRGLDLDLHRLSASASSNHPRLGGTA